MVSADEAQRPGSDEKLIDEQIAMEETAEPADDQAEYSNGDESITDDVLIDDTARLFNPIKTIDIVYTHYDGESYSSERLEYDIDGHLINSIRYKPNSDGALTRKYIYEYNECGDVSMEMAYDPDGSLVSGNAYKYDYDVAGHIVKKYVMLQDQNYKGQCQFRHGQRISFI